jgi:hypothetical protein
MVLCTLINELLNPGGRVLFYGVGHVLSDGDRKDVAWCFRLRVSFLLESLLCTLHHMTYRMPHQFHR